MEPFPHKVSKRFIIAYRRKKKKIFFFVYRDTQCRVTKGPGCESAGMEYCVIVIKREQNGGGFVWLLESDYTLNLKDTPVSGGTKIIRVARNGK